MTCSASFSLPELPLWSLPGNQSNPASSDKWAFEKLTTDKIHALN